MEWGLTSNTGGLLGLFIRQCRILMKGLPQHDAEFETIMQDPNNLLVVLWPEQNMHEDSWRVGAHSFMPIHQVRRELGKRSVVLVAVDGTWRNARRMVARLPQDRVVFTNLPLDVFGKILGSESQRPSTGMYNARSMLTPLRGRGSNVGEQQVCTAEAVVGALLEMGLDDAAGEHILSVARRKVDLVCRYRGKVPRC